MLYVNIFSCPGFEYSCATSWQINTPAEALAVLQYAETHDSRKGDLAGTIARRYEADDPRAHVSCRPIKNLFYLPRPQHLSLRDDSSTSLSLPETNDPVDAVCTWGER